MSEIWNLSALCRCCHADGDHKSLKSPYKYKGNIEIYSVMLYETFGIEVKPPSVDASYEICDECIVRVRDAASFKRQVLNCEQKFQEYCDNEQSQDDNTSIKCEVDTSDHEDEQSQDDNTSIKCKVDTSDHEDSGYMPIETKLNAVEIETDINHEEIKIEKTEDSPADTKKIRTKRATKRNKKPTQVRQSKNHLIVHVNTENGVLYSCDICGGSYDKIKDLKNHISRKHNNFHCEVCKKQFSTKNSLELHGQVHGAPKPYSCTFCKKSFASKTILLEHLNLHTGKMFTCDLCMKSFPYKASIRRHLKMHEGTQKNCICDTCGHRFNDTTNLRKHIETVHLKLRPFSCKQCTKTFTAKKYLLMHSRLHTGGKPNDCQLCSKSFITNDQLRGHQLTSHKGHPVKKKERRYRCRLCREIYTKRGPYYEHIKSHVGYEPFRCQYCSKTYICKYSLRRHEETHSGLKPYQCEICQQAFTQKDQVYRHIRNVHNPNKPVKKDKCTICKQNVYNMEKHLKIHSKRPFSCSLCEKTYPMMNTLNRHMKLKHLLVKNFSCDVCDKRYTRQDVLRLHKLKAHKVLKEETDSVESEVKVYAIPHKGFQDVAVITKKINAVKKN